MERDLLPSGAEQSFRPDEAAEKLRASVCWGVTLLVRMYLGPRFATCFTVWHQVLQPVFLRRFSERCVSLSAWRSGLQMASGRASLCGSSACL